MNREAPGKQVRVGGFVSRGQAELVRGYLVEHGVDAVVVADDAGAVAPHFSLGAGGVALAVAASQVDEARRLLSTAEARPLHARSRVHRIGKVLLTVVVAMMVLWVLVETLQQAR